MTSYTLFKILGLSMIVVILISCYNDNEETLYPVEQCDTSNISYTNTISPIINNYCLACHDNKNASNLGGNLSIEGYDNLKKITDNGLLKNVINHESGFSPMPKGSGKMPACEINKIEQWINQGAPNN